MISVTIEQLLEWDSLPDLAGCRIYLVKEHESDLALYVGKTRRWPGVRLMEHLGKGDEVGGFPGFPDWLGLFVLDRMPKALQWKIEFYTPVEVLGQISHHPWDDIWMDIAETKMISTLHPALNVSNNPEGSELPTNLLYPSLYLKEAE